MSRSYDKPVNEEQEALLDDLRELETRGTYDTYQVLRLSWPDARKRLAEFVDRLAPAPASPVTDERLRRAAEAVVREIQREFPAAVPDGDGPWSEWVEHFHLRIKAEIERSV